jgi:uncharacterized protein YciI
MAYYVIRSEQGPAWNPALTMREQTLWTEHAAYLNSLLSADKMILGGPIGDGNPYRAMAVFIASSEAEVRARLDEDPWYRAGVLRVVTIENWNMIATNDKLDPGLAALTKPTS